jgi:MFS family permease
MAVYFLWLLSWMLAGTFFEVYFYGLGLSISDIFLANAFWFIASLFLLPFFKSFDSRKFMLIGIAIAFAAVSLLYLFPQREAAYFYRFLIGMTHVFFWLPFNTLYYESRKENNAFLGAIYYSVGPFLSLMLPAAGGFIASSLGFPILYLVSMASYAITFLLAFALLESKKYKYDIASSLKSISGLKSIIFLEGFAAAIIISVTLELMLLRYISKPLEFGEFLSLTTVFSIVASIVTAKISDKQGQRRNYLIPSAAAFAIAAILTSQTSSIALFFLGFGLINFFSRIFFPLPFALAVDNTKSLVETMAAREFMLNLGRVAGALAGYAMLIHTNIETVLLFQGAVLLLYIPIFESRKHKLQKK